MSEGGRVFILLPEQRSREDRSEHRASPRRRGMQIMRNNYSVSCRHTWPTITACSVHGERERTSHSTTVRTCGIRQEGSSPPRSSASGDGGGLTWASSGPQGGV